MGLVIWYKLEIDEPPAGDAGLLGAVKALLGVGLPVKVSNDPLSGAAYIVDSDINVSLQSGPVAGTFDIKIVNLPTDTTELLRGKHDEAHKKGKPLQVKIFLGYFDDLPVFRAQQPVIEGAVLKLKSEVNDSGLMETTIKGQELTGYQLRTACNVSKPLPGKKPLEDIFKNLLAGTGVELAQDSGLKDRYPDFTPPKAATILQTVQRLAEKIPNGKDNRGVPVVVRAKQLKVFKSVGAGDPVVTLTEDNDIVKEDGGHDAEEPKETLRPCNEDQKSGGAMAGGAKAVPQSPARANMKLTVLGNTKPYPGDMVSVKHGDKAEKWRVEQVAHQFSSTSGFTTILQLVDAQPGDPAADPGGALGVVQRFQDRAEATDKTAIDVGEVSDYAPGSDNKHLATLNYGQDSTLGQVSPSVTAPINQQGSQLLNKPILSPFAFHKTGLMVPIYPKMRAVLAHNQGATNDAIVAGFLWPEDPRMEPPKNHPGDYWLCLPTELSDGLPSGKGVNDLTDAKGERLIQAKGIKIFVGSDDLPPVGDRPNIPTTLDGTLVIEHQKGARITITSAGAISIETSDGAINITTKSKDIAITNGEVNLKLSGQSVEVS